MAKTKISDLGYNICLDNEAEKKIPALGDGSSKPGLACSIAAATGKIELAKAGALERFIGLLLKRYDKSIDTAPADLESVDLVQPKSGRNYRVWFDEQDLAADLPRGTPVEHSTANGGRFMESASLDDKQVGYLALPVASGQKVAEITWA